DGAKDMRRAIYHNLGCMHHVAFMEATEQEHLDKATSAFESAVAASEVPKAGLFAEYGNFLLKIGQLAQAHGYLIRALGSEDIESSLSYNLLDKPTVSPLLQERIDQVQQVQVRGIDYAFYLLIHHYADFQQAGITLEKSQADY